MSEINLCVTCQTDKENVKANLWCIDCAEFLCSGCANFHTRKSPPHVVVQANQDTSGISSLLELSRFCESHPAEKVAMFCCPHDCVICASCVAESHQNCHSVISIEQAAEGVTDSTAVNDFERISNNFIEMTDKAVNEFSEQLHKLDSDKEAIEKKLNEIRQTFISHLDSILKSQHEDLTTKHQCVKQKNTDECGKFEEVNLQISSWKQSFEVLKEAASDVDIFKIVKVLHRKVLKQQNMVDDLKSKRKNSEIQFQSSEEVIEFKNQKFVLGKVLVVENDTTPTEDGTANKAAQVCMFTQTISPLHSFNSSLLGLDAKVIEGCFIDKNNLLLVAYKQPCLYACHKDGSHVQKISLTHMPGSVAKLDENVAVVSLGTDGVGIIDLGIMMLFKEIKINGFCERVATCKGKIWVGVDNHLLKIDRNGHVLKQISKSFYKSSFCVDSKKKIYCSSAQEVYVFSAHGHRHVFYQHPELRLPSNIALDNHGNVFVLGSQSNNIHKISPDGKQSKIILTKENGIDRPSGLAYNSDNDEFLVINKDCTSINIYKF